MNEMLFVIIATLVGFLIGGIFGLIVYAVWFPYAWYGLIIGLTVSAGVCVGHIDF